MVNLQFLGFPNYNVGENGEVWSTFTNKYLKHSILLKHHDKYAKVMLTNPEGKHRFICVHRLVAYCYLDKGFGMNQVNHIDGDIYNNHVSNLEWVTPKENSNHSLHFVRKPQGISNPDLNLPPIGDRKDRGKGRHSITKEEAVMYCEYMMQGYRACDLRIMTGISPEIFTIFKNHRNHKWKEISDKYDFSHLPKVKPKLQKEQIIEICERLQDGETVMSIYTSMGLCRSVVRGIKNRRSYKHINVDFVW